MESHLTEITHGQVTPDLLTFFDINKPTMPRAFNVLEGLNRGQILVDDPDHPTCAVVRDGMYGTLYFGGKVSAALPASLVLRFGQTGEVGIGCWLEDPINEILPPDFDYNGRTYYFTERSAHKDRPSFDVPAGFSLLPRDEQLFRKSFDFQPTLDLFGRVESVLKYTLGLSSWTGKRSSVKPPRARRLTDGLKWA